MLKENCFKGVSQEVKTPCGQAAGPITVWSTLPSPSMSSSVFYQDVSQKAEALLEGRVGGQALYIHCLIYSLWTPGEIGTFMNEENED